MLDLVLSIATIVCALGAGLLLGAGTRGRMRFRAEPVCARCGAVMLYEPDRGIDRCGHCGITITETGLRYFRRRWIWSALLLGLILAGLSLVTIPAAVLVRHLLADPAPELPKLTWFLHVWLLLAMTPLAFGFVVVRCLLGRESAREPRCADCGAKLDAQAIFDAGACGACGQTFLEAGAPRTTHRPAWVMWAAFVLLVGGSLVAVAVTGPEIFTISFP
ncbi:MAG: hypothetical protein JNL80_14835 [Phycisphaerae bacterium]|nr:hypothetical protein [Phycisphaerae bacterium]